MKFNIDPSALHEAANKFNGYAAEYETVSSRLMNAARTMGSAWDAADNQAFVQQIEGLCEDLKGMASHLKQGAAAMNQQATNYETVRDNNVSAVKKLSN